MPRDSQSARPDSVSAGSRAAADTTCPLEGLWRECSVRKRLEASGFVLLPVGDTARTDFMGRPPLAYQLGTSELYVFVYPTVEERDRALADVDTAHVMPKGRLVTWSQPPTLITSSNLAAILLSANERLIERVQNSLTAGLPP